LHSSLFTCCTPLSPLVALFSPSPIQAHISTGLSMCRRRKADLATIRNKCALLRCNRVFAIPELLNSIMFFLNTYDVGQRLKYSFVCHHWNRYGF
jgi:hypothetical protein